MFNKDLVSEQQALDKAIEIVPEKREKYFTTKRIAYIAMLVAINVVVGALSPRIQSNKLTFTYAINFIAGYFFGGISGVLVGGLGDLLGCLIGGYVPNPFILLSSCLLGLIPALIKRIPLKKFGKFEGGVHILISYVVCTIVCTAFINSYGLWLMYANGRTFWVYMAAKVSTQSPVIACNLAISLAIFPVMKRIIAKTQLQ